MANGGQVLSMLIPTGGFVIYGDDFDSIIYDEGVTPITKKQFEDGFSAYDAWKAQQDQAKAETKAALLDRLGITADEVALLLG
jgi:hypothetical protein